MTAEQEFRDHQAKTEAERRDLLRNGETREQVRAAEEALQRLHALRSQAILAEFNKATTAFVEYSDLLQDVIDRIQADSPAAPALRTFNSLLSAGSTIYSTIREPERLRSGADYPAPTRSRTATNTG